MTKYIITITNGEGGLIHQEEREFENAFHAYEYAEAITFDGEIFDVTRA